ncbi:MAG: ankyrin repeat domain-containing protein, partial [Alphaproteobacteria bacterium]|nr:ankyrin repeat domain-containing protein [Alphaproteobacteria bacterium]
MIDLSLLTQEFIDESFARIVLNGNKEEVAFYAEFVKNPNLPEPRFGRLPIWMALEHEEVYDKTKIILSLNPDVNVKNELGQTPAMVALSKRMSGVGVLFLRHASLDVNAVDKNGDGLMKYAVLSRSAKAVFEAAKVGVALSPVDSDGNIPAYYAVMNDDFDVFEALCLCGLKRDMNDEAYRKVAELALQKSVEEKSLRWIRAVRRGIFPKEKNYKQTTSWRQLFSQIKRLPVGMQAEVRQSLGLFSTSTDKINLNIITRQNVQDVLGQALIEQVRYGSVNDVAVLLRLGVNPNTRGRMGRTALFCAVESMGNPEEKVSAHEISDRAYRKVKLLLEAGANPNLSTVTPHNREHLNNSTPIVSSLLLNRLGITRLLIKNGALLKTTQN